MPQFICHQCQTTFKEKLSARTAKTRPRKHVFCNEACYNRWRADQRLAIAAAWLRFQREVWGTTEHGRRDVAGTRQLGRIYEAKARDSYLPAEGFTEIFDLSAMSTQFFVDFVATRAGERVLVDATIKLKAYIPHKARLAEALHMRLFIMHISPAVDGLYHLNEVSLGRVVSMVPAARIRALGLDLFGGLVRGATRKERDDEGLQRREDEVRRLARDSGRSVA